MESKNMQKEESTQAELKEKEELETILKLDTEKYLKWLFEKEHNYKKGWLEGLEIHLNEKLEEEGLTDEEYRDIEEENREILEKERASIILEPKPPTDRQKRIILRDIEKSTKAYGSMIKKDIETIPLDEQTILQQALEKKIKRINSYGNKKIKEQILSNDIRVNYEELGDYIAQIREAQRLYKEVNKQKQSPDEKQERSPNNLSQRQIALLYFKYLKHKDLKVFNPNDIIPDITKQVIFIARLMGIKINKKSSNWDFYKYCLNPTEEKTDNEENNQKLLEFAEEAGFEELKNLVSEKLERF